MVVFLRTFCAAIVFAAIGSLVWADGHKQMLPLPLPVALGGTASTTASAARTALGLGTIATQDASAVAITGGTLNGTLGATTPASVVATGGTFTSSLFLSTNNTNFSMASTGGGCVPPAYIGNGADNYLHFIGGCSGIEFVNNAGSVVTFKVTDAGVVTMPLIAAATGANAVCAGAGGVITTQAWATGCVVSSARFKESFAALAPGDALAAVGAWKPVSYRYRPEIELGDERHYGFTAEQIAAVTPDMATSDAVKYQEMAPYFAGAIQALRAENDELRARLRSVEDRLP